MWGVSEQTLNYSSAQMRFQNYVFYFVAGIYSYDSNCVEKKNLMHLIFSFGFKYQLFS